jgi:hypothetical protein
VWLTLGAILAFTVASGCCAVWRHKPSCVVASFALLNVAGGVAWAFWSRGSTAALVHNLVLCCALGAALWTVIGRLSPSGVPHLAIAGRTVAVAAAAIRLAVGLLAFVTAWGVVPGMLGWPHYEFGPLGWIALAASALAVLLAWRDRSAGFSWGLVYALGLIGVGMNQLQRAFPPGRPFVWASLCEWTAFVLMAALLGWLLPQAARWASRRRMLTVAVGRPERWFLLAQATVFGAAVVSAGWIAVDFAFDGIGADMALFGLAGRRAGCPAALMLVGAAILMAWQTRGAWRSGWQYAALGTGVLFTSSLGWSGLDAACCSTAGAAWFHRGLNLLFSSSIMTVMTGFGLGRVLPKHSDWIARGRQAMPAFAGLTLLLVVLLLLQWSVQRS